LLLLLAGWMLGPASSVRADKAPAKITYDDHVLPILREKCFACHSQDKKRGGLSLSNYTGLMTGGGSGEVIKPGDLEGSLLYKLITHQQEPYMPPRSETLPKETLATIAAWIQGGALENAGSKAKVVARPRADIALSVVARGKPEGPPPMPEGLSLEPIVHTARANALTALAASPWAPLVAVAGQHQILLYHADTLQLLGVLPFPEGVAHVLHFSRNGSLLLAGGGREGKSGRVVVWKVRTGERLFEIGDELDAVLAADISADQSQIALGGPSKVVRIYSTKDGKLQHEIKKHTDWIYALEFSPDGVLLASGDRSGGLYVWEAFTGREYFTLRGHTAAITDVSWRIDSNVLASGSEDATVRLWEMENGTQFRGWGAGGGVQSVKYAHDGRLVSCGRDRLARLWDPNGAALRAFEAFPDIALRGVFTHDSARVIAGDWSGEIRVWSTADGRHLGRLTANPPPLAEQMQLAAREVTEWEAASTRLSAAAATSQAAAQKAAAELAAAQQAAADASVVAGIVAEGLARAKDTTAKANAALASARAQAAAKEVVARAFAEAAAKVKDAAGKTKENQELALAAQKSGEVAAHAYAELTTAQKAVAALEQAAKAEGDHLASAERAAVVTASVATPPAKVVQERTPLAKAAVDKAAADTAAAAAAMQALAVARSKLDGCKTALAKKK
jgi:hypothetical protein